MIAYLKGTIMDITENNLILDVNQIGYNVKISPGTANMLPGIGEELKIHIYTCVREDAFVLYGFLVKDDVDTFKKIITVNGIGPKGALGILSIMSADELRIAILNGDGKAICKAPGIGIKTAERLILDLKDKVSLEDTRISRESVIYSASLMRDNSPLQEAIEALASLKYTPSEVTKAVNKITYTEEMATDEILKLALKEL